MPGRSALAARLRKQSVDTVDRALKELIALGAVHVEHRKEGMRQLTNRYLVRTTHPGGRTDAAPPGRNSAAGPAPAAAPGRSAAAGPGRMDAAPRAADLRP